MADLSTLSEDIYNLALQLWNRFCNFPSGPPGVPGPTIQEDPEWNLDAAYLESAALMLKAVEARPDAVQVLRDLYETGSLGDHYYEIREREGLGWEGPRMLKWGAAEEKARKLMKNVP